MLLVNAKGSFKAGDDGCLDLLHHHSPGSPCFSPVQQDMFHCGVDDSNVDVDGQAKRGPNVLHLQEGCPHSDILTITKVSFCPCLSTVLARQVKLVTPSN